MVDLGVLELLMLLYLCISVASIACARASRDRCAFWLLVMNVFTSFFLSLGHGQNLVYVLTHEVEIDIFILSFPVQWLAVLILTLIALSLRISIFSSSERGHDRKSKKQASDFIGLDSSDHEDDIEADEDAFAWLREQGIDPDRIVDLDGDGQTVSAYRLARQGCRDLARFENRFGS